MLRDEGGKNKQHHQRERSGSHFHQRDCFFKSVVSCFDICSKWDSVVTLAFRRKRKFQIVKREESLAHLPTNRFVMTETVVHNKYCREISPRSNLPESKKL